MNVLTKFHEDRTINVASRVLTRFYFSHIRKNALPLGSHVFQAKITIFELIQDIIGTNHMSKKNAPPPSGHVFQPNGIIFELVQDIIGMNLLTKFHKDLTINVVSRVKNAPPLGSHDFQANVTIFKLIQDIIETNLLTKFHEDWTINAASREFTRQMLTAHDAQQTKGDHKSSPSVRCAQMALFIQSLPYVKLDQDIGQTNILVKTIFKLNSHIKETNFLTKFHENWAKMGLLECSHKNAPPTGGHVFSPIWTIFELVRYINKTNVLTNFLALSLLLFAHLRGCDRQTDRAQTISPSGIGRVYCTYSE
ncbi:hypothetical protein DPMN_100428 [Dreissena polymorpha]|uniref:Uncharacterized protein n=1 Tax=Dreissena polymorpha TaxID=45954 RepID=A0A9D4LFW9_DREPO|nr:hypothetical protein DPMN_100428 [Dreissena polymorpha]